MGARCPICREFVTEAMECKSMLPATPSQPITLLPARPLVLEHLSLYAKQEQWAMETQLAARMDAHALHVLRESVSTYMRKEVGGGGQCVWWSCFASELLRHEFGGRPPRGVKEGDVLSSALVGRSACYALRLCRDPVYVRCVANDERTADVAWREVCRRACMGSLRYTPYTTVD